MLFKNVIRWATAFFILYAIGLAVYLFGLPRPIPVPESWIGTVADPAAFIPSSELKENALYARIRDFLYFLQAPFTWLVLFTGLVAGWFWRGKMWVEQRLQSRRLANLLFLVVVLGGMELVQLPFRIGSYALARHSGISNMTLGFWLTDQLKSSLLSIGMMLPVLFLLYLFIRNSPRHWWLWMGAVSIPLILFYSFIQPTVLDPLFNDYELLRDSELKADILAMADAADIPTDRVYEVDMSKRTNALNAYVTGIGSNARIVLWDTMLEEMTQDEVLFTMAHEMGHYKMKHVALGTWLSIGGTFLLLFLLFHLSRWLIRSFGRAWGIPSLSHFTSLPVLLLVVSMLQFMATPVNVGISRIAETAADEYALELTAAPEAGISGFQELARTGRAETYPPSFIRWWRYTHPSISERLHRFSEFAERGRNVTIPGEAGN